MKLNQTKTLMPDGNSRSIQAEQQKQITDLEEKVTELQDAVGTLSELLGTYAETFTTGRLTASKINSPEIDAGNGSGTGQVTTDDLTVHDSAHINSLQVDEINGSLSLDGDLSADNVTASKVTAETVDASNGAGTGSVKTNSLTADTAEIGTLKTSGIDGALNIAGNTSVTGNASITGGTSTDSVNTKSVTVHNADNTGTVTTDELNVTESARLAEAEIGEINGGLVVNGDIIADGVTTGDIMANDITAASATADTVKAKIIAPKDGEEEVRHTASRSQFDHDVYVDGTLYVDTFNVGDLEANHALFLGSTEDVTADNAGNFTAGKNATVGNDLSVGGNASVDGIVDAGDVNVSKDLSVHGDLYVAGSVTATEEKQVATSGRYLITRDNNNSGMAAGEHSGIAVNNYTPGKIATCTADKDGTWRISDSATGTAATYTDMSAYNGNYFDGISQTAKAATLDILTNVDADEMSDVALYSGSYYKLNGSDWYTVTLTSGALALGEKVTDADVITALEALPKYPLVYYRTVTSKSIDESQNQPILTRAEEAALSDGGLLKWDSTNKKAIAGPNISTTVTSGDTNVVTGGAVSAAIGALTTGVSGVKGNAESTYRGGNVNITPANIGLGNVNNTADANKAVLSASKLTTARKVYVNLGTASTTETKDFSSDTAIPVNGTLKIANGGTGLTGSPSILTNLASSSAANVMQSRPRPGVTGILPVANGGTGASSLATVACYGVYNQVVTNITTSTYTHTVTDSAIGTVQKGDRVKITFDCALQSTVAITQVSLTFGGCTGVIKSSRGGSLVNVVSHLFTGGNYSQSYPNKVWDAYTTLDLVWTGSVWFVSGDTVLCSYFSTDFGYEVKANGLIKQWGVDTDTGASGSSRIITVTGLLFTQIPIVTFSPCFLANSSNDYYPTITNISASSFTVNTCRTGSRLPIRWFAIGY